MGISKVTKLSSDLVWEEEIKIHDLGSIQQNKTDCKQE